MNLILSGTLANVIHESGLAHRKLEGPVATRVLGASTDDARTLHAIVNGNPWLRDALGGERPSVLLGDERRRGKAASIMHRVWSSPVPDGALWYLPGLSAPSDVKVLCVSPVFDFVLRTRRLTLPQAALLAMDRCSLCRIDQSVEGGLVKRSTPLANADELRRFVSQIERGQRGRRVARRAAELAMDRAMSPRESALALLLTMRTREGGFGLPEPVLNRELDLPDKCRALLPGQRTIRFDLLWPEAGIAVEYDSATWHDNERRLVNDKHRAMAASSMGIDSIAVTGEMVRSLAALEPLVDRLHLAIRGRLPWRPSTRYLQKRETMRAELFRPIQKW